MSGDRSQRGASWAMFPVLVLLLCLLATVGASSAQGAAVQSIASGQNHACVLTSGGGVKCWGDNSYGQLGDGTTTDRLTPVDVSGLTSGVIAVGAGALHTCAVTTAGGVKCWGRNNFGQLGDGTTTDRGAPVDVSGLTSGVSAAAAGGLHTCAVTTGGGVKCWGFNANAQLGDGTMISRTTPVDVSGLTSGVVVVAPGGNHSCALTAGGGVKCWGLNLAGQLGDGTTTTRPTPVDVSGLGTAVAAITSGSASTCALRSTGGVECWGYNGDGQLGDGTTTNRLTPVAVSGLTSGVAAVGAGNLHACAVTTAGGLKCWGYNAAGQIGDGTTGADRLTPVDVIGLASGVAAPAAGNYHTCALTASGGVKCWGHNADGQLGDGTMTSHSTPGDVIGLTGGEGVPPAGTTTVATGLHHSCAVTAGGGVKCWGANASGQLGDGTTTSRPTPVDVAGLRSGVAAVVAGTDFTCALSAGGGVKCWGANASGQLGDGTTTARLTPVDVAGLATGVTALAVGNYHVCAVTTGGGVKCWGFNLYGQLGDGTTTTRTTPVDASGLTSGVAAVSAGLYHTCVVTTGGGVKCWGNNDSGELGDGTTTDRLTSVWVSGLTSGIASVAGGGFSTCALTSGGGVKCWGQNTYGQLGDGSTTNRLTPVDVGGLTSGVASLSSGYYHACALTRRGKVECWGLNNHGQLGDGTTTNRSVAADVIGLSTGAAAVASGYQQTCAVTSRRGAQCWGHNAYYQLGDGTTVDHTTPVWVRGMVPGVRALAAGSYHSCRVTPDGGVQCWGLNSSGQLGDDTTVDRHTPVTVSGLSSGVVAVAAGEFFTCALTENGGVKCWGLNNYGQLGNGVPGASHTPVDVVGLTSSVVAIAVGQSHACALTAARGVQCWGKNDYGQLGDATHATRGTPAWVTGLTGGAAAVAAGSSHSCVLTTGGAVRCWGRNLTGELGDGTTTERATPVWVSGLASGVTEITTGALHTCALTGAGGVKCWGRNAEGQLGDGTQTSQLTPVDVSGLTTDVATIAAGEEHTCAVTTSGALKCWGWNGSGQLGDGTTSDRLAPVSVSESAIGVGAVTGGGRHTCAMTTSGAMRCWGYNADGEVGDGTTTDRLAPMTVRGGKLWHDFDGDVKADIAVYRPASGTWFSLDSSTGNASYKSIGWGVEAQSDTPAPGDFDGDGMVDPTVYRPGTGTWFILESSSNYTTYSYFGWGASGDTPVPADYDGDGKTDGAVYRPSTGTWYIRPSSGATSWNVVFGTPGDVPLPGDYDGDGKADLCVYRPLVGTWFVLTSASGFTTWWYRGWGIQAQGDVPAPGDYDGDGKVDLCVFRPASGTWFILETHAAYTTWDWFGWGASGDTLVPSDFDGDAITDAAVYRASTGTWYIRPSSGATQWSVVFGQAGDVPLLKIR